MKNLYRDLNIQPEKIYWKRRILIKDIKRSDSNMWYFYYKCYPLDGEGWTIDWFWKSVDKKYIKIFNMI